MKQHLLILCMAVMLGATPVAAQLSPYQTYYDLYDEGRELFEKEKYGAAEKKLAAWLTAEGDLRSPRKNNLHANAKFMEAVCAYKLDRGTAVGLLEKFVKNYPDNSKASVGRYYLGKAYFEQKQYLEASTPLRQALESNQLSNEPYHETLFMLGYCYFSQDDKQAALTYFEQAGAKPNKWQDDAQYYRAVILYQDQDFEGAYDALSQLQESEVYGRKTRVYLANCMLKLGKQDELYVLAESMINGPRIKGDEAQVYYLVANAGYERSDYPRATEYFKIYQDNNGRMNPTDFFRNGFAHYKMGEYESAIPQLERAALVEEDSLSQIASYYLGFCFLETKQNNDAQLAFQKAALNQDQDHLDVGEDALYQYAKVSFATGNYDESLAALNKLRETFPNAPYAQEVQSLIGEIFLYQRNYPEAIKYFESINRTSDRSKRAYQLVCFYHGLELFERPRYQGALVFFRKAIDNPYDLDMAMSAQYWMAETRFRMGDFSAAKNEYQTYLNMRSVDKNEYFARAHYGMGWVYYKEKKHKSAISSWTTFTETTEKKKRDDLLVDAMLRIGDAHFLLRQYSKSNEWYQKVLGYGYTFRDYAAYQQAEGYYRLGNYSKSVETFGKMVRSFPKSEHRDEALDQSSEVYVTWLKDYENALKYSKQLVTEYPRSPLAPIAYNRMGLAAYNLGRKDEAAKYYKTVLEKYYNDKEQSRVALDNLPSLVSNREFDKIVKQYSKQNPNMDENLAQVIFNTGKDRFFDSNYQGAVDQFSIYISDYKNGPDYLEALLLRARSYMELGKNKKALEDYRGVYSTTATNSFTAVALQEAAELQFANENYVESLQLYTTLGEVASDLPTHVVAWFGTAESHEKLGNYAQAEMVLNNMLANDEIGVQERTKARVQLGFAQYEGGNLDGALETFAAVEQEYKNELGAKSNFMMTQILFDQGVELKQTGRVELAKGKFEQVMTATKYQKNAYPTFDYWKARTFLVAANASYENDNSFQAKGILNSLVKEERYPDVQAAARKRLDEIEAAENASSRMARPVEDETEEFEEQDQ
ncbi:tetratricopeptide repeat protein [Pontibacter sp. G13]|uniref:tetratricopeptide repeat protein n=1 Tax=Pontibacter sp. G13 TaxID=3074898 RepID=UPI00288B3986|nr:tetratricopeptide repeat protein [Pontibacter sp. G13]WNJ18059.1 tetratricopeptide repeat protein [Pontibacter sp. G13]